MIKSIGNGKSYNYLKFIAKPVILRLDEHFYELEIIYLTSSKLDKTV